MVWPMPAIGLTVTTEMLEQGDMIPISNSRSDGGHAAIDGGGGRAMSRTEALRVVIADDHAVYRQGLARLLERSGIDVVGEAANGLAAIELVERAAPHVAVIDLNMPGLTGAEVTRRLTERLPAIRVLVVSVSAQEDDVTEAILAGASGYVLKDSPVEEVAAGIRAAAAGEALISPRISSSARERSAATSRASLQSFRRTIGYKQRCAPLRGRML